MRNLVVEANHDLRLQTVALQQPRDCLARASGWNAIEHQAEILDLDRQRSGDVKNIARRFHPDNRRLGYDKQNVNMICRAPRYGSIPASLSTTMQG